MRRHLRSQGPIHVALRWLRRECGLPAVRSPDARAIRPGNFCLQGRNPGEDAMLGGQCREHEMEWWAFGGERGGKAATVAWRLRTSGWWGNSQGGTRRMQARLWQGIVLRTR